MNKSKHSILGTLTEEVISPQSAGQAVCRPVREGGDWRVLSALAQILPLPWSCCLEEGTTVLDLHEFLSSNSKGIIGNRIKGRGSGRGVGRAGIGRNQGLGVAQWLSKEWGFFDLLFCEPLE